MMRFRTCAILLGLLLPMVANCSSPPGRYQRATIQERDGVPCFGVADSHEARTSPPLIAKVSVGEVGNWEQPVWERIFLHEKASRPALSPSQCLAYGEGGTPAQPLQTGKRYEVVISGHTPGTSGNADEAQKRVFNACFYFMEAVGKGVMKLVISDCSTAHSSGPPPVRAGGA